MRSIAWVIVAAGAGGCATSIVEPVPEPARKPSMHFIENCLDRTGLDLNEWGEPKSERGTVAPAGWRWASQPGARSEEGYKPEFCDIRQFAVAVKDFGETRRVYKEQVWPPVGDRETWRIDPQTCEVRTEGTVEGRTEHEFDSVFRALDQYLCRLEKRAPEAKPRIAVFAHGGLVDHQNAVLDAEVFAPAMLRDGYFPLFLIWNSDFQNAYGGHLVTVTNGTADPNAPKPDDLMDFARVYTHAGTKLLGDLGSGIFRAPQRFFSQYERFEDSVIARRETPYYLYRFSETNGASEPVHYCQDATGPEPPYARTGGLKQVVFPELPKCQADDRGGIVGDTQMTVQYGALLPVRLVTTTLAEGGTMAWDNMVRRTRLPFVSPYDYGREDDPMAQQSAELEMLMAQSETEVLNTAALKALQLERCADMRLRWDDGEAEAEGDTDATANGGFARLLVRLQYEIECGSLLGKGLKIDVFGHSMGAIVANEMAAHHPDLPYRRFVFMGAAATIRDTRHGVWDLMKDRPEIEFYNLMLHPLAESRELAGVEEIPGGIVPQGSLLEWIDEMFGGPRTRDDRTVGKWLNVVQAGPNFSSFDCDLVQERMFFRVFPVSERKPNGDTDWSDCADNAGESCHPTTHGGFNDYTFWRDRYLNGRGDHVERDEDTNLNCRVRDAFTRAEARAQRQLDDLLEEKQLTYLELYTRLRHEGAFELDSGEPRTGVPKLQKPLPDPAVRGAGPGEDPE